jgi:hypothetical protein
MGSKFTRPILPKPIHASRGAIASSVVDVLLYLHDEGELQSATESLNMPLGRINQQSEIRHLNDAHKSEEVIIDGESAGVAAAYRFLPVLSFLSSRVIPSLSDAKQT